LVFVAALAPDEGEMVAEVFYREKPHPEAPQLTPDARGMEAITILENEYMVIWYRVTRADVLCAIKEYDRPGPERFYSEHGFAPTTTYELPWKKRRYPPKAILGTAYEFATGQRLGSSDFEGGKSGAVAVFGQLGFTIQEKRLRGR
jgi:hypothetical protein